MKEHYASTEFSLSIYYEADFDIDEDEVVEVWQNNRDCEYAMSLIDYISEAEEQLRNLERTERLSAHVYISSPRTLTERTLESLLEESICAEYPHIKFTNIKVTGYCIYKEVNY